MNILCESLLAIVLLCHTASAAAQVAAGVVKTTRGSATVQRAAAEITLMPGTIVQEGDRLLTGNDGYVGLTMLDDTLLTLGPGSDLILNTYAFDAKTHDGNFLASLTKGVLSVVTGLIARRSPESFIVKTRVSTMGVRGTEFIVEAQEQ